MTLTTYAQLKAYWFNPKVTKVELRIRDTRRFTSHYHQEDILARLAAAKAALDGRNELSEVPGSGS